MDGHSGNPKGETDDAANGVEVNVRGDASGWTVVPFDPGEGSGAERAKWSDEDVILRLEVAVVIAVPRMGFVCEEVVGVRVSSERAPT